MQFHKPTMPNYLTAKHNPVASASLSDPEPWRIKTGIKIYFMLNKRSQQRKTTTSQLFSQEKYRKRTANIIKVRRNPAIYKIEIRK